MRKLPPFFFVLTAFFLIALAVGLAYARTHDAPPKGVTHAVSLLGDHAEPNSLIMKMGESVEFKAGDDLDHDMGEATGPTSGVFHPADSYRLQFNHAGNFTYYDHLHPGITISIVVYDPSK